MELCLVSEQNGKNVEPASIFIILEEYNEETLLKIFRLSNFCGGYIIWMVHVPSKFSSFVIFD